MAEPSCRDYDGAQAILSNSALFRLCSSMTQTPTHLSCCARFPILPIMTTTERLRKMMMNRAHLSMAGAFIYSPQGSKPIIITVPHPWMIFPLPRWDMKPEALGRPLPDDKRLRPRGSLDQPGFLHQPGILSDPLRNPHPSFQHLYKKFADTIRDQFGVRSFLPRSIPTTGTAIWGEVNRQISLNPRPAPTCPSGTFRL